MSLKTKTHIFYPRKSFIAASVLVFLIITFGLIPFHEIGINYELYEKIWISTLSPLLIITTLNFKNKLRIDNCFFIAILFSLTTVSFFSFSLNYPAGLFFFTYLLFLYFFISLAKINNEEIILNTLVLNFSKVTIYLCMAIYALQDQGGRFSGLHAWPTGFSVWITLIFLISVSDKILRTRKTILCYFDILNYFIVFFLVYSSGTRINFFFFSLLGGLLFFDWLINTNKKRMTIFFLFTGIMFFSYQIYVIFHDILFFGLRDVSGGSDSFNTRYAMLNYALEDYINNLNVINFLFGSGAGSARTSIISHMGSDYLAHHDFIALIFDYGALVFFGFMFFLMHLASKNKLSFFLVLLYVSSFLHNMVFTLPVITLAIITSAFLEKSILKERKG